MSSAISTPKTEALIWKCFLPSPEATNALAERLAPILGAGDAVMLSGPIGAGKTHFARALIQARLKAVDIWQDVPSPTFTLVQTYQADELEIWHADLYRLGGPADVDELGLFEAFDMALTLVEWPERLGSERPAQRLELRFETGQEVGQRNLTALAFGSKWHRREAALSELFRG